MMLRSAAVALALAALCAAPACGAELVLSDFEDLSAWEGLKPDASVVRQGKQSGLWEDTVAVTTVRLKACPKDWSRFRTLEFWAHSAKATGKRIDLIAMSDRGNFDYFQYALMVDWAGWRRLRIPFHRFWQTRAPRGWGQVGSFFLSSNWGDKPAKETVIRLDDMRLTDQLPPGEPEPVTDLMTDAELFARLDLGRAGMAKVRAAVGRKDLAAARGELVAYTRARRRPRYFVDPDQRPAPDPSYDTRGADRAAQHIFTYYRYPPHQLGPKIDWQASPVADYEWPTALNRHGDLSTLARAWFHTGQERYARALEEMLVDWIANARAANAPLRNVFWSTLNIACRLIGPWPDVWYCLRDCDAFTPEARIAMLKSLWHQSEYLMRYQGGANWLLAESRALVTAGTLFPEFRRAAAWKAEGWRRLSRELQAQTYAEGAQFELTPHYHLFCTSSFRGPVDLAKLNEGRLPDGYLQRLERMYEYVALVSKPDRCIPMLNDSDHNDMRSFLREGAALFPRDDLRYLATDGKEGRPPRPTSVALPHAGQYVMRTGWDRRALYCLVDAGPFGYAHQHEDKLSLDIHAYGADLVLDPGRFTYAGGPFGEFFRSSRSHNLVVVDGQGQHRAGAAPETWVAAKPVPATWASREGFDYVRARYDEGFGPNNDLQVAHERAVLFLKPDYWVVCDFLIPAGEGEHSYDWLWHFGPGEAAVADGQVRFQAAGAGLVVATTLSAQPVVTKGAEQPVQGWVSYWYGEKEPAPAATFSAKAVGPTAAITVLAPFAGQSAPEVRILDAACTSEMAAARIRHAGKTDVVLFARRPGALLSWQDAATSGEAACLRMAAAGKVAERLEVESP